MHLRRAIKLDRIKSQAQHASFPWMMTTRKTKMRLLRSRKMLTGRATHLREWMGSPSRNKTAWSRMRRGSSSRRRTMNSRSVFSTKSKKMRKSKT